MLVVLSHAFQLADRDGRDPLLALTGRTSLGTLAVWVFFAISGYLVTESWLSDPQPARYALRRALRIGPGLLVAVVAAMLVIGPLFSSLGPRGYFADPSSWHYASTGLLYVQQYTLPGVFQGNHWGSDVNSSLWTLRYELMCYALVPLLVARGAPRSRTLATGVATLMVVIAATIPHGLGVGLPGQLEVHTVTELLAFFATGATLRLWSDRIVWRAATAGIAAGVATIGVLWSGAFILVPAGLAYATLYFGLHTRTVRVPLIGSADLSYGTYIYGFLVEQAVVNVLGGSAPTAVVFGLGLPVTLGCALLSWRFVEYPALRLKSGLARTRATSRALTSAITASSGADAELAKALGDCG